MSNLEQALGFEIPMVLPIIIIIYIAITLAAGLWAARRVKNTTDWYVGGRSLGAWITALTHGSSALGGGVYVAGAQYGWEAGLSSLWAAIGDIFGPVLNLGLIGKRMRRYTEKTGALTLPEFFAHRYESNKIKNISIAVILAGMILALLVGYMAMAFLLIAVTGWNYNISLIASCVVILVYTGLGGYLAVAYSEFVQAIFMVIGMVIMVPVCIKSVHGFTGIIDGLNNAGAGLGSMWGQDDYLKGAPLLILGIVLVYLLGYMGQPHLVIKTFAARDDKAIKYAPFIGMGFAVLMAIGVYVIGMVGRVLYPDAMTLPDGNGEYILPMLALSLLPAPASGLVLAGAIAAIMSTSSAILLLIGTTVGNDLFGQLKETDSPDSQEVMVSIRESRIATFAAGVIALAMCFIPFLKIGVFQLTWVAWSVVSPALIPAIVGGLFWKKGNRAGAGISMIVGSVTGASWYYLLQDITGVHTFIAALVFATLAYVIGGAVKAGPSAQVLAIMDYARGLELADIAEELKNPETDENEAVSEDSAVPAEADNNQTIKVIQGVKYTPEKIISQISGSGKFEGIEVVHVDTLYSLCWIFKLRIGLKVSENKTQYAGYFAGFDELVMSPGKLESIPTAGEEIVDEKCILPDKMTKNEAIKAVWKYNVSYIVRKFKQLKSVPELAGFATERMYKKIYVIEFRNGQNGQVRRKCVDSLTGDWLSEEQINR